ncbi:hypothetical protein P3T76_006081 [Phytophthora citrophthora]|uniref:Uncharacterized protein n=1 Tax=Phytophthora citrophthora TaxID=4793 RepID=A0AAD9GQ05_9STRA|nr:hypothetical protein P3T76_006081 [Phytophthora citrophthora]
MEATWGFETPWRTNRDDDVLGATWSFLHPWCDALKRRIEYNHSQYGDGQRGVQKRQLVVTLPMRKFCSDEEVFHAKFKQAREALALLSAVASVDQSAWKYLLSRHCGVNLGKEGGEKYEEVIPARFLAVLDVDETGKEGFESDLVEFCGVSQWKDQSEAFRADLEKIAGLGGNSQTINKQEEVRIPIRVLYRARQLFSKIGDRPVDDLVKIARAEETIKAQWETYRQNMVVEPRLLQCFFVLEPMIANFNNYGVNRGMSEIVHTLVSDNVWFSHLTLSLKLDSELKADEHLAIKSVGQLVTSVFDSSRRSSTDSNTQYYSAINQSLFQIDTVAVYCDTSLPSWTFEALLSTMVASQTTERLHLSLWVYSNVGNIPTATIWKWVAYALFSKRARSTLKSLVLTSIGSMTVADIEAFTAVMTSEHPENELFGLFSDQGTECYAVLQPKPRICHQFGEEVQELMLDLPATQVQTFHDDGQSEWVNAIVPGYGRCLLRRDELGSITDSRDNHGGISSLSIELKGLDGQVMNGFWKFLEAVGPSLQLLTLDSLCIDFDCTRILQCCPKLEELSLRSRVVDVRFNFQDLNDCAATFTTDWTDVVAAATDLQDSNNLFTRALRQLRVRLNCVRNAGEELDEVRIKSCIVELLRMLEVNETLEFLDVVAPTEYYEYFDVFRAHHLKPISRSVPLSMESKVAFLSILSNTVEVDTKSGHVQLGQHVLYQILEFAAPPIARQVYFREWDWLDAYNGVPL